MKAYCKQTIWDFSLTRVLILLIGVLFVFYFVLPTGIPWLDLLSMRKRIYQICQQRVETAGGWNVIEKSCLNLVTNVTTESNLPYFYWYRSGGNTNSLPKALQTLQPREIRLEPDRAGIPIMRVKLSGMHATGGNDTPYFGIWVICTNIPADFQLKTEWHDHGMRGLIRKVAPQTFEVL